MKTSVIMLAVVAASPALAFPSYVGKAVHTVPRKLTPRQTEAGPESWAPPGPDDARGPCPGLNALANHGFLPRNGKNISEEILQRAMSEAFNIAAGDASALFSAARLTTPGATILTPATTFDLFNLGREGVLEHDISISRSDRFFADPLPFNETIWAETFSYFTEDLITVQQASDARMGRLRTSQETNPEFSLNAVGDGFSWGEVASFFSVIGDNTTPTVRRDFIDYWIRNERLPYELGWQRQQTERPVNGRSVWVDQLTAAAGL